MPSAVSPRSCWNARTARSRDSSKTSSGSAVSSTMPSTASRARISRTASPRSPRRCMGEVESHAGALSTEVTEAPCCSVGGPTTRGGGPRRSLLKQTSRGCQTTRLAARLRLLVEWGVPHRRASRRLRRILGGEDGYLRVSGGFRTVEWGHPHSRVRASAPGRGLAGAPAWGVGWRSGQADVAAAAPYTSTNRYRGPWNGAEAPTERGGCPHSTTKGGFLGR